MRIGDICERDVIAIRRDAPLMEASSLMRNHHVGCLVVTDAHALPVGIVTDRDIVVEVVAAGLDYATLTVGEIMEPRLETVRQEDDTLETLEVMRRRGVRRIPVVDGDGKVIGIVSIDDLLESVAHELSSIVHAIRNGPSIEGARRP